MKHASFMRSFVRVSAATVLTLQCVTPPHSHFTVQSDDPDLCFVFSLYLHKLLSLLLLLPISRECMRQLRQAALASSARHTHAHAHALALAQGMPLARSLALPQPPLSLSPSPHLTPGPLALALPGMVSGQLPSPAGQAYLPGSAGGGNEGMAGGYQQHRQAMARGGTWLLAGVGAGAGAGARADATAGGLEDRLESGERQRQWQHKHEEQEAVRGSAFFRLLGVMGAVYESQPQLVPGNAGLWQFVVFAGEEQCSASYALVLLRLLASLVRRRAFAACMH